MSPATAPWNPGADPSLLVVSPHLDDAVLSVGGLLASRTVVGTRSSVLTIFSGSPEGPVSAPARAFLERCGLTQESGMSVRRAEDRDAGRQLGVDVVHAGLQEALYRCDTQGQPLYARSEDIFSMPDPDLDPPDRIVEVLGRFIAELRPDCMVAPLGVGIHVDHLLTRHACEAVVRLLGPAAPMLVWYEDIPYALYDHLQGWEGRLTAGRSPRTTILTDDAWLAKIEAVSHYRSQLDVLWYDPAPWAGQLRRYAQKVGSGVPAERLWVSA